eukprot:gene4749-biopygen3241
MHEMVSEMALLRQALMTQLSSAAGTVGAPTPVSTSATSVPATGVASAGNATVAQSSGAPTPDATPATATQETAGSAVPCFELFNIATWPAHLGHLSKYDRKDFLEEHLLADEQRYVKLQKTPFTILLSLVDAACEFPKNWTQRSIIRSIQYQVAPIYFFKNTHLRQSTLRVHDFIEALERDQAFDKPEKFAATVKDLEPKKQVHTVTLPDGPRKNFHRAPSRKGA